MYAVSSPESREDIERKICKKNYFSLFGELLDLKFNEILRTEAAKKYYTQEEIDDIENSLYTKEFVTKKIEIMSEAVSPFLLFQIEHTQPKETYKKAVLAFSKFNGEQKKKLLNQEKISTDKVSLVAHPVLRQECRVNGFDYIFKRKEKSVERGVEGVLLERVHNTMKFDFEAGVVSSTESNFIKRKLILFAVVENLTKTLTQNLTKTLTQDSTQDLIQNSSQNQFFDFIKLSTIEYSSFLPIKENKIDGVEDIVKEQKKEQNAERLARYDINRLEAKRLVEEERENKEIREEQIREEIKRLEKASDREAMNILKHNHFPESESRFDSKKKVIILLPKTAEQVRQAKKNGEEPPEIKEIDQDFVIKETKEEHQDSFEEPGEEYQEFLEEEAEQKETFFAKNIMLLIGILILIIIGLLVFKLLKKS